MLLLRRGRRRVGGHVELRASKADTDYCAEPATPGLWAVEPHFAYGGIGVKFEELLVVTDTDAYWLDDDLPHVRRWRQGATRPFGRVPHRA